MYFKKKKTTIFCTSDDFEQITYYQHYIDQVSDCTVYD